jgi:putative alpha-1,2-mannosidase
VTSSSGVLFALGRLASTSAELRVGLSFMSPALARANLAAALDAADATATTTNAGSADDVPPTFEALAAATETVWCSALAGLVVSDSPGDPTLPTLLHSAHYRTYLSPTVYSEPAAANGEYTGLDQQLHSAADDALALGGCPVPQRLSNKAAAPASNASSEAATETSAAAAQALLISSPSGGSSDPASFEAWATASQALSVAHFSDLSNWDTFRSVLPWLLLTQEPVAVGLMRSMAAMTQQQGAFPRWPLAQHESDCMIGNHAASLLVDALLVFTDSAFNATTGAPGEPFACGTWAAVAVATAAAAQPALLRQATVAGAFMGRVDLAHYLRRGFVSLEADDGAAVSTLTYAFDDYLLGVLSQRLADLGPGANGGLDPAPLADAAADALRRAANYQTVFSREHLYMCPRSNGTGNYSGWLLGEGSDATVDDDAFLGEPLVCPAGATHVAVGSKWYREGDAWHYAYWAPHDVPGLVALHSSPTAFHASLAAVMAQSTPNVVAGVDFQEAKPNNYYWAGNEHNLLNPFLFNYGPNCSAAQYWSRRMTELHYHDGPAGLPGNDDYGAMTTWLLFASLGFFPNAGAGGLFLLGAPRVANATVRLNAFAQPTAAAAAVLGAAASAKPKAASAASFTVVAHDQGPGMYFVRRLLIDGADWASPFLPRAVLANGPTLEFFLTSDPAESGLCPHAT